MKRIILKIIFQKKKNLLFLKFYYFYFRFVREFIQFTGFFFNYLTKRYFFTDLKYIKTFLTFFNSIL